MNSLTPNDLLQIFPFLMYAWSAFILGWGVITGILFYRAGKVSSSCKQQSSRKSDRYALWLIALVNVFLLSFLVTYKAEACTSWIAVVNVFYTAHLLYISVDVARWWRSIKNCYHHRKLT
jgi:hypothetical protein